MRHVLSAAAIELSAPSGAGSCGAKGDLMAAVGLVSRVSGRTPLHHAAELGHADCLGQLLDAGSAGELGLLKVRIIGADLVTVNGEDFSPRLRQGMELWVEVEVEQRPPIVHPTLKTSVQVDVDNLHWNNTLTFRCCHRDAKVTLRLMYRHAGLTKKEKDLILGSFSCTLPAALAVAGPDRAQRDEPAVVVLESYTKTKERERREAQRAARGVQAHAGADLGRAGSSDRWERRSSGSAFHRKKSGESTTSDADRKSGRDDKVKTGLRLRGAIGAVIAANRLARSQEMDEEGQVYFYNHATETSTYEDPLILILVLIRIIIITLTLT